MRNKYLLPLIALFLLLSSCAPSEDVVAPAAEISTTRVYHISQQILLVNHGDKKPDRQNLWVALIRSISPYQEVRSRTIRPNHYELLTDEYGNEYAEFDFSNHPPNTTITVEIEYEVAVNEILYDLSNCKGDLIEGNTSPELHIESANPQIIKIAENLSKENTICEQARAFYDYVGDNLHYTHNRNDWGAQATLGYMGSDCTEYASLLIALSRAENIPARYFEGILYLDEKTSSIAYTQHAWLDLYLPGVGWAAMDPTLGRMASNRDNYFAHYTPDHVIVTEGRNPSTLRGSSYITHLYWPGSSAKLSIDSLTWELTLLKK